MSEGNNGGTFLHNLIFGREPRRPEVAAPKKPEYVPSFASSEHGIDPSDFEESQHKPYMPATKRPVGIPKKADPMMKYTMFDDHMEASDLDEVQQYETVPRPLTGSGSKVVDKANAWYGEEVNPIRKANNAIERTMPTTPESIFNGIWQVPKNLQAGAMVLVDKSRREKLDEDTRTVTPLVSTILRDGPQAIVEDATGAMKDSVIDALEHPLQGLQKIPKKVATATSLANTPEEERDRLKENIDERLRQIELKVGTSIVTGGMLSYMVKQGIMRSGMPGARIAALLAGISIFGVKSIGALSEAMSEGAELKRTVVGKDEGRHFDKRLQKRIPGSKSDQTPKE